MLKGESETNKNQAETEKSVPRNASAKTVGKFQRRSDHCSVPALSLNLTKKTMTAKILWKQREQWPCLGRVCAWSGSLGACLFGYMSARRRADIGKRTQELETPQNRPGTSHRPDTKKLLWSWKRPQLHRQLWNVILLVINSQDSSFTAGKPITARVL